MNKFFIKSFIFFLILCAVVLVISQLHKTKYDPENDYMAAIVDKHQLLKLSGNKRLILVSGSSLAFGVNSENLERELKINVVNMALQAGLGCEFIINEVSSEIKKGDIVLLGLEYHLYDDNLKPNVDLINHTQSLYPPAREYYKLDLLDKVFINIENFRKFFQPKYKTINTVYNRKSFNRWGDVVGHLELKGKYIGGNVELPKMQINNKLKYIHNLYLRCADVGATLYIAFPCYPLTDYNKHQNVIESIRNEIAIQLPDIKVINNPATFVFPDKHFFDTEYHLTAQGRDLMTKGLIELLHKNQVQ